jgi:ATP-dependent DNA helicase DinG
VPTSVEQRLTISAAAALRAAVADAGGNEVFALGTLDDQARIDSVRIVARGNRHAAPALVRIARPGEVVVHNHPSGILVPSDADIQVSSLLGNEGVGSYIVDNDVRDVCVVVEPHREPARVQLSIEDAAALLSPGGAVADRLEGYEHRPEQLRMLEAVTTAFNDDAVLTVEAGTGTGKSLAYLLPAISWSLANKERVIVSTHTINLQEQLVSKDLPFLTKRAGYDVVIALVKGRGNYVCQRKAAQARAQGTMLVEDDLQRELGEILAWAATSKDGSLSDLPARPRNEVWEQVVSENDNCLRARCPHYSTCFFYTARRAAAKADIVVVNHHLLMADLAMRQETDSYTQNAVLPPAKRVIIDEAHHLEDVATNYFGARLSWFSLERTFGRLQSLRDVGKGVLPAMLVALDSITSPDDREPARGAARWIEERLQPQRQSLAADAEQCFVELLISLEDLTSGPPAKDGSEAPELDRKIRVLPELRESPFWRELDRRLTALADALLAYVEDFEHVFERVEMIDDEAARQVVYLATELRAMQSRIGAFAAGLHAFVGDDEATCRWIEIRSRPRTGKSIAFCSAPISVASMLRGALFDRFDTAVLTSATLAVGRRFDYLHDKVGLDRLEIPERVGTLLIDSPFDFPRQALLAVPDDIPEPTQSGYEEAMHAAIRRIIEIAGGGTFVLFTAYGALNRAVDAVGPFLRTAGLTVLQQGQMNRQVLLERFVNDGRAVLFATDSFWEGVDVRGSALRCVLITRLPFRVPTEPIEQARVDAITARGGNAFNEHTVPQAVIKLKQGFGRLIRARSDYGAVVLLDSRVVRKKYGSIFLNSLPPATRCIAASACIYDRLTRFFASHEARDAAGR